MFKCDKCGLCCRHINLTAVSDDLDRGDGICKHLDELSNLCRIYDNRPVFCNVDKMYLNFSDKMTVEKFYEINYLSCNAIKAHFGQ